MWGYDTPQESNMVHLTGFRRKLGPLHWIGHEDSGHLVIRSPLKATTLTATTLRGRGNLKAIWILRMG